MRDFGVNKGFLGARFALSDIKRAKKFAKEKKIALSDVLRQALSDFLKRKKID
jgi:hypothetical protein